MKPPRAHSVQNPAACAKLLVSLRPYYQLTPIDARASELSVKAKKIMILNENSPHLIQ